MNLEFRKYSPFLFFFAGYFVADCLTTWYGIILHPGIYEGNPILHALFAIAGMYLGLILFKTIAAYTAFKARKILVNILGQPNLVTPEKSAWVLGIMGFLISGWNTLIITGIVKA